MREYFSRYFKFLASVESLISCCSSRTTGAPVRRVSVLVLGLPVVLGGSGGVFSLLCEAGGICCRSRVREWAWLVCRERLLAQLE